MRRVFRSAIWLMVAIYLGLFSARAGWFDSAWVYRKSITVNYTNVAGTLTNFPVLISRTDTDLQSYAKTSADDLLFTSNDGLTKLAHEIESYSNGTLIAWVKVPYLTSYSNTVLYLYYGNPAAANQQNAAGVWDANFSTVWHLKESGSGNSSEFKDATSNARHARGRGGIPGVITGKIGNGQIFDGMSDYIEGESNLGISGNSTRTLSFWVNLGSASGSAIAGWGNANNNENFTAGAYAGYWTLAGNGTGNDWTGIAPASTGAWQFHTVVHNGSTARWYVNGMEIGSGFNHTYATKDGKVLLGQATSAGTTYYLNGVLDEVRISNLARSPNWIRTEYTNQTSPSTFTSAGEPESGSGRLVITSVNGGMTPKYGTGFSVTVTIQNAAGVAQNATNNTFVTLSLASGAGTLAGALNGTISNGVSSVTLTGVTYNRVESGVSVSATRSSGDILPAGTSSTFSVAKAPLTVTANAASRIYGTTNPIFTASYSGWVNADSTNVLSGSPALSTSATITSSVGTHAITAALGTLSASNYTIATFSNGTLTITKASSALTVGASANPVARGSNVVLTATVLPVAPATGTATGTIQFCSDGIALGGDSTLVAGVARITNSTLAHGAHTIAAEYVGDGDFIGNTNSLSSNLVINTTPSAGGDTLLRYPTSGVKTRLSDLLANDSDADTDSITLTDFDSTTANGGTLATNGVWLIYGPAAGFTNSDSFSYHIADSGSLTATATVNIVIAPDTAPTANISSSQPLANGNLALRFQGILGRSYTIQFTTNLVAPTWLNLTNLTANDQGIIDFIDATSANAAARTYRTTYP